MTSNFSELGIGEYLDMQETTKILTVDDSHSMRALLKRTWCGNGYEVVEAEDGMAALDWLERKAWHRSPGLPWRGPP